MKTDQEWEAEANAFYTVMEKLELDDLKLLTHIFECYPNYVGEVTKSWCKEFLWKKLRDWRCGDQRAAEMSAALRVLGVGR